MRLTKRIIVLSALLTMALAACSSPAGVEARDAWSRPVPPVSPASAVFFELHNGTDGTITLTGADSAACAEVQIHETALDEAGVMSMRPLFGGLEVAPGSTETLAPGGIHLMCMSPDTGLDSFDMTLRMRNAEDIVVPVVVEDR